MRDFLSVFVEWQDGNYPEAGGLNDQPCILYDAIRVAKDEFALVKKEENERREVEAETKRRSRQ